MAIVVIIIIVLGLYFFYSTSKPSTLPISSMSCDELMRLEDDEFNKLDFSCKTM